jgi:hypothetical protein
MPTPAIDSMSGFALLVEDPATPGTFVAVSFVERWGRRGTRTTTTRPVFGQAEEVEISGRHRHSLSVSGMVATNDPGQTILRTAAASGASVNMKATKDGTAGYTMLASVADDSSDESADSDVGNFAFTLTGKSAPAAVGTGGSVF